MPHTPDHHVGYQRTDTSHAAAASMGAKKLNIQQLVITALRVNQSMTADEIADFIGRPYGSVRPRLSELRYDDKIRDSGTRRDGRYGKSQIVWRLKNGSDVGETT